MHITSSEKRSSARFRACFGAPLRITGAVRSRGSRSGLLFYYKALTKNPVSGQGYALHDRPAADFFRHAAEVIARAEDPAASRAYIYGFICHFALDSECHPYVEKMIHDSGIGHSEIEMEFDRKLMKEDYINPVVICRPGTSIRPGKCRSDRTVFENMTPELIEVHERDAVLSEDAACAEYDEKTSAVRRHEAGRTGG